MEINISILKHDMFWVFMKKQSLSLDREFRMIDSGFITPVMTSCFCLQKNKKKSIWRFYTWNHKSMLYIPTEQKTGSLFCLDHH